MIIGIKTNRKRLLKVADAPVIGGIFLFITCFVPAVAATFFIQYLFPSISGDPYFGYILGVILPLWNLLLYIFDIRLSIFYIPAWLLFGAIGLLRWIFDMK